MNSFHTHALSVDEAVRRKKKNCTKQRAHCGDVDGMIT